MLGSWLGSWVWLWCVAAAAAGVLLARRWRSLVAHRLIGRSLIWRVRVRGDGSLAAGLWRLRLYGVAPMMDGTGTAAWLQRALEGRAARLRVLLVEGGALVVVLRCGGENLAIGLLRAGLAQTRGTGARRYRQAQGAAQCRRCGAWRLLDAAPPPRRDWASWPPVAFFPWWQG